jgi:hypothetical protein
MLAVGDRAQHELARDAGAADQLGDDRDRRIVDDRVEVVGDLDDAGVSAERGLRLGGLRTAMRAISMPRPARRLISS